MKGYDVATTISYKRKYMKYQYYTTPDSMKKLESFGFSWLEFVTSVPSPMFLVTSYKSNGKPNACMQSWATFTTGDKGRRFYAILSSVNKKGHLYIWGKNELTPYRPRTHIFRPLLIFPLHPNQLLHNEFLQVDYEYS